MAGEERSEEATTDVARPALADVLSAMAADVNELDVDPERVIIQQATPTLYMYRVYPAGGGEYEGGSVNLG